MKRRNFTKAMIAMIGTAFVPSSSRKSQIDTIQAMVLFISKNPYCAMWHVPGLDGWPYTVMRDKDDYFECRRDLGQILCPSGCDHVRAVELYEQTKSG